MTGERDFSTTKAAGRVYEIVGAMMCDGTQVDILTEHINAPCRADILSRLMPMSPLLKFYVVRHIPECIQPSATCVSMSAVDGRVT